MNVDARLKELGVEPVVGDQFLVVKEDELREIEQKLAVRLPESYRKFLLTFGAVGFKNIISLRSAFPLPAEISTAGEVPFSFFYGSASDPQETYSLVWAISTYSKRMPSNLIPIGGDLSGNQICLGIRGAEAGKVYYWDHDNEWDEAFYVSKGLPVPLDLKFQNVHLVAENFEDFLRQLYVYEYGE